MEKHKIVNTPKLFWILSVSLVVLLSGLIAAERSGVGHSPTSLAKTLIRDSGQFDGNRIADWMENNGMFVSQRVTGNSGMEWPKGSGKLINYASGIWVAGKVGNDIRTACAEYGPEYVAGPWGSAAGDAAHQFYIVNKSDLADPLASDDFQNWPVDLGAPWVDEDGDGVYTPMPSGTDHPEFIGDQVIWYVMNDGDVAEHTNIFKTLPLGVEVQMTIWGYNRPDGFGDMMFVKSLIINKGNNDIDDTYIGLWSDPDLGYAGDDFVACDTALSLGYCYNDGADLDYGEAAPAIGYDFFQGPIVESPGDTAFAYGRDIPGYKNLRMSSFIKYINTDDPNWSDPNSADEAYNLMKGLRKFGDAIINTETGDTTKFVYPEDPGLNTGAGDGIWADSDDHASGDRRFLMNTGPFTLADGDSQEVVFSIIIAQGSSALSSIMVLKEVDALAQLAYDIQFALPPSPGDPEVTYTTQGDEINLMWDNAQESYIAADPVDVMPKAGATTEIKEWVAEALHLDQYIYGFSAYDTMCTGEYREEEEVFSTDPYVVLPINPTGYKADSNYASPVIILGVVSDTFYTMIEVVVDEVTEYTNVATEYVFEGYNVWQYDNAVGSGKNKLIATFDKINDVTEIKDMVFDATRGENVQVTVQHGSDFGVRNHFTIGADFLRGGIPLKTNRAYYFAVTAYGYNPYGIPRTLEGSPVIMTIRPADPIDLDVSAAGEEEFEDIDHTAGVSDGAVDVVVVDPLEVTGHDYEVSFDDSVVFYLDSEGEWQSGTIPSKSLGKVLDVSPSTVTATAYVAGGGAGTTRLDFALTLTSPDGNWADGFKLTLPAGITIISASVSGAINSDNQTPGFETATIDPTANTVMWGNDSQSEWGAIEGNAIFSVVVEPVDPPISVDWVLYDDKWSGDKTDASGTVEITELVYETKTIQIWNVTDLSTSQVVAALQTIVGGENLLTGKTYADNDDAGWTFFDGIKIRVSGAPAHTVKTTEWTESGGAISPLFSTAEEYDDTDEDGAYDYDEPWEDYGAVDQKMNAAEPGYVAPEKHHVDPNSDDYYVADTTIWKAADYDPDDEDTFIELEANLLGAEGNGVWNPWPYPEPYTDADSDGKYDLGEAFQDVGTDSLASVDEPAYLVMNLDATGDNYRVKADTVCTIPLIILPSNPTGTEGNKVYDVGEKYTDANGDDEWTAAEPYTDSIVNEVYDAAYDTTAVWPDIVSTYVFHAWNGGFSSAIGTGYPKTELRFVEMQSYTDANANGKWDPGEAYTWDQEDPNAGYVDMYEHWGAGRYTGYFPVPYTAWNMDTEPATQLHIVQRDRDDNNVYDAGESGIWNYIWITSLEYTGATIFDGSTDELDWMNGCNAQVLPMPGLFGVWLSTPAGYGPFLGRAGKMVFDPARDNLPTDKFVFSTKGAAVVEIDMAIINVWPNPYFGYNPEERTPVGRMMQFTHLPPEATIRIFNLAGQLVKKIEHIDGTQFETWDLTNNFDILVASGMYIAYIYSEEYGDKILKLAVIQAEQRLDVY